MSSLMNWDGSQDAQKRREAEEARAKAPEENTTASDLTHGSTSGQSDYQWKCCFEKWVFGECRHIFEA